MSIHQSNTTTKNYKKNIPTRAARAGARRAALAGAARRRTRHDELNKEGPEQTTRREKITQERKKKRCENASLWSGLQGWQPKTPPKACFKVTLGEPNTSHRRQCASGERPTGGRKDRDKSEPDSQHNKTNTDSWKGCQKPAKKKLSCFHDRPAGAGHPTRACQAVYGRSPTTVQRRDAPGHRPSPRWYATSHWEQGLPGWFFFFRQAKCYGVQGVRPEPANPPNPKMIRTTTPPPANTKPPATTTLTNSVYLERVGKTRVRGKLWFFFSKI